jgi:hypothetical protein
MWAVVDSQRVSARDTTASSSPSSVPSTAYRSGSAIARRSARSPSFARSHGVTEGSTLPNLHGYPRRTVVTTRKSETGRKPGNQTPNTPDIDESEMSRSDWKKVDAGKHPGNQSPNTPRTNESER